MSALCIQQTETSSEENKKEQDFYCKTLIFILGLFTYPTIEFVIDYYNLFEGIVK